MHHLAMNNFHKVKKLPNLMLFRLVKVNFMVVHFLILIDRAELRMEDLLVLPLDPQDLVLVLVPVTQKNLFYQMWLVRPMILI